MDKMDEMIVVAPRSGVFGAGGERAFQGTLTEQTRIDEIIAGLAGGTQLMRRGDAEQDPSFKQPIPYVVLARTNDSNHTEVFVYERLRGGGETRLHNKLSIGVGGHMNTLFDGESIKEVVAEEAERELEEELIIDNAGARVSIDFFGLINDDLHEVGQVHIGLLARIDLPPEARVTVRETNQLRGSWHSLADTAEPDIFDRLETWSQYAVRALG